MKNGIFIFEGIDGCGKTTQCNNLKDYLQKQGIDCFVSREPGGTLIGEYIRSLLKSNSNLTPEQQLMLFCIARKEMCNLILDTIINTNKTIILDRFALSTYAYQGIDLDENTIKKYLTDICPKYECIIKLAQTIYLDVSPENSLQRINNRGEQKDRYENLDTLKKVHDIYDKYIKMDKNAIIIDANQCAESVWLQIQSNI